METSTDELCLKGEIDDIDKAAVGNINGHSSATVKKYYLKRHRGEDVLNSRKVFKKLVRNTVGGGGGGDVGSSGDGNGGIGSSGGNSKSGASGDSGDEGGSYDSQYIEGNASVAYSYRDDGNDGCIESEEEIECVHKYRSSPNKRIPWSAAEVNFVGEWCNKNSSCTNVIAQCRKYILSHPEIKSIFHPSHIIDSGRLRHGADAFAKKIKEQQETK